VRLSVRTVALSDEFQCLLASVGIGSLSNAPLLRVVYFDVSGPEFC
jgi:hypothetical protein